MEERWGWVLLEFQIVQRQLGNVLFSDILGLLSIPLTMHTLSSRPCRAELVGRSGWKESGLTGTQAKC